MAWLADRASGRGAIASILRHECPVQAQVTPCSRPVRRHFASRAPRTIISFAGGSTLRPPPRLKPSLLTSHQRRGLLTSAAASPAEAASSGSASSVASTSSTTLDDAPVSSEKLLSDVSDAAQGSADQGWFASLLEPLISRFDSLPALFHLPEGLPHSYVISIVLATILLRTSVTLPFTFWQRRRVKRFKMVVAELEKQKQTLPMTMMKQAREQGLSHKEYEGQLKQEFKRLFKELCSKHKCARLPTMLVPPAVHIPFFITGTYVLRAALVDPTTAISAETVPWWSPPAELMEQFEASAKVLAARGIEGEALAKLTTMYGPTLGKPDKSMISPIVVGALSLVNVELQQWLRRSMVSEEAYYAKMREDRNEEKIDTEKRSSEQSKAPSEKRPVLISEVTGKAKPKKPEDAKPSESVAPQHAEPAEPRKPEVRTLSLSAVQGMVVGNLLRVLSIVFVIVSMQAPSGLVIYWISSAGYTLIQNICFAIADHRKG